jgi:Family of unknown function (DUF5678)
MEPYRDRHWFDDERTLFPRTFYEHHQPVLPSRVIAEYCEGDTAKVATFWIAYHNAESSPEPQSSSDSSVYDDGSLVWVAANCNELYQNYPNQWILVEGKAVVASSEDPQELAALAEKRGIRVAFITRVAPPSKPQRMVYARQVL